MKRLLFIAIPLMLIAPLAHAQGLGPTTVTGQVGVTVTAEAALSMSGNLATLTPSGNSFSDYTGTTSFTYYLRTGKTSGSGFIKLQITTDFTPTGGPSVTTPVTAGDTLSYTCTVSSPATSCSGSQVASVASQTVVSTFVNDAHTTRAGNSASINWDLSNDPLYETGTFTAVVTYTISAS